ncbi:GNAT family N-acetyltransferase [Macellibacteroides fermentans]|uniref:GNAT family N-acetyltransferase n=1 Tax=Macellibacteroides fermentans TaxID=879969 RepID=UPI00406D2506
MTKDKIERLIRIGLKSSTSRGGVTLDIKTASIHDVKEISYIHASSWKTAYKGIVPQEYLDNLKNDFWIPSFEKWISDNTITAKLAYTGNEAIGCISYGKSRDISLPDWGEIVSLYVLPKYLGRGFGKALLMSAINDMYNKGFENIYLWVLEENLQAQKFYRKNGFIKSEDKLSCEISGKNLFDLRFIHQAMASI